MNLEDFRSTTWRRLERHLNERITDLREANDGHGNSVERTAAIRGSIAECKRILALTETASAGQAVTPGELTGGGVQAEEAF